MDIDNVIIICQENAKSVKFCLQEFMDRKSEDFSHEIMITPWHTVDILLSNYGNNYWQLYWNKNYCLV